MKLNKILLACATAAGLAATSCVGDLDLKSIDPNELSAEDTEAFMQNAFAECYSSLLSGPSGPGSSIVSGADGGTSNYTRLLFMMTEFTTDEAFWIWWSDEGVPEMIKCTYNASTNWVYQTYSALYAHIAICNQFISQVPDDASATLLQMRDEARALRALSYYWVLDLYGNGSFTLSTPDGTTKPSQISRAELYKWLEGELTNLVDNSYLAQTPPYGRVGIDGAEALLARLYLNAGVYTGVENWAASAQRCKNIISRHEGANALGGLAEDYYALFSRDNHVFMPGGGGTNEILWGIAEDADHGQTYGATRYLISSCIYRGDGMLPEAYGTTDPWGCLKARNLLTERFDWTPRQNPQYGEGSVVATDYRASKWIGGTVKYLNDQSEEESVEFTVDNTKDQNWLMGYTLIKWTGLKTSGDFVDWGDLNAAKDYATQVSSTDYAFIRLSDVYLMYAECAARGAGSLADATTYVNYLRTRAQVQTVQEGQVADLDFLLDERSRELYWELTRRTDLIRFGKYTGPDQLIWNWKGGVAEGVQIADRYNIYPIPSNVLGAQSDFVQNQGW